MSERQQRYYDGLDPDNLAWKDRKSRQEQTCGAILLTLLALGAFIALAFAEIGCGPVSVQTVPAIPWGVHTCTTNAQVWIDGPGVPGAYSTPTTTDATGTVSYAAIPRTVAACNFHFKHDGAEFGQVVTIPAGGPSVSLFVGDCDQASRAQLAPAFEVGNAAWIYTPLPPLAQNGKWIEAGGQPWFGAGASSFRLFELWLKHDPTFDAVVADLAKPVDGARFNLVRVWTLYNVTFSGGDAGGYAHLVPSEWPTFYTELRAFVRRMAVQGFYVEVTAFTGTKTLMPTLAAQQAHLDQIAAVAREIRSVMVETGNEYEQGDNAWEAWALQYPTDIVISGGSVGGDNWPSEFGLPTLSYALYHSNGTGDQWHRKMAHEPQDIQGGLGVGTFSNENEKPTDSIDQDTPQHIAEGLARVQGGFEGCKLLANGCTFHSTEGRMSKVLTGINRQAADAALRGIAKVPMFCQREDPYGHPVAQEEAEGLLRKYTKGFNPVCVANLTH